VRIAYQVLLRRSPDPVGLTGYTEALAAQRMTNGDLVETIRASEEFINEVPFGGAHLGFSLHTGRCQFIRSLPPARRILDLGGNHLGRDIGAMVAMGYPYPFDDLTIVDLPSEDRHPLYQGVDGRSVVVSPLGPVSYRYHSMSELSGYGDSSRDLVYSGQSIEHVTRAEGGAIMAEVARILSPGGYLGLDTPNARVTRLQQEALIDPDHKVEYLLPELVDLVIRAGLDIVEVKGINDAGASLRRGRFDLDEVAASKGIFARAEDCYLLCVLARNPD